MLDPAGFEMVRSVASDLGMKVLALKTVTGHDALAIQKRIPSSLIFVPSQGGLSHNPREFTAPEALDKGYDVLVETLWRMVTAEGSPVRQRGGGILVGGMLALHRPKLEISGGSVEPAASERCTMMVSAQRP